MTLRCGSCGANLRVPPQILEGKKTSARCPRCKNQIPINGAETSAVRGAEQQTIRVECGSCGAKLKAPARRIETSSRCPRCQGTITIPEMGTQDRPAASEGETEARPMAARGAMETSQEESGVTTRRIDSRTLGMMGMGTAGGSGEIDLDDLVRKNTPATSVPSGPEETPEESDSRDLATALMNPPVEDMKKAAESIRESSRAIPSEQDTLEKTPENLAPPEQAQKAHPAHHRPSAQAAPRPAPGRRFPVFRGLFAGGLSGALLGAALMSLAMSPVRSSIESFTAPLPVAAETLGLSEPVLRLTLLAVLGALVGFVAAGIGASSGTNALNVVRCGLLGALAGAALGMSGGMDPASGFRIWPMAHWVRDLMLVGLLTPALNRVIPGR